MYIRQIEIVYYSHYADTVAMRDAQRLERKFRDEDLKFECDVTLRAWIICLSTQNDMLGLS